MNFGVPTRRLAPLRRLARRQAAFTLIEMMVVVAIVGILTTAIVGNYGSFRSATVATNMAYEVAATLRQAQLYGLGVRILNTDETTGSTYGVELYAGDEAAASYVIFQDRGNEDDPQDGACGGPDGCNCSDPESECVEHVRMLQSVAVEALCASDSANVSTRNLLAGNRCELEKLGVTFTRPNPEATMYRDGTLDEDLKIGAALIRGGGHCRLVRVYANGQISVEGVSPADAEGTRFQNECNGA